MATLGEIHGQRLNITFEPVCESCAIHHFLVTFICDIDCLASIVPGKSIFVINCVALCDSWSNCMSKVTFKVFFKY